MFLNSVRHDWRVFWRFWRDCRSIRMLSIAPGATNMSMNFSSFTANSSVPTARNNLSRLHSVQRTNKVNYWAKNYYTVGGTKRANRNLKKVHKGMGHWKGFMTVFWITIPWYQLPSTLKKRQYSGFKYALVKRHRSCSYLMINLPVRPISCFFFKI